MPYRNRRADDPLVHFEQPADGFSYLGNSEAFRRSFEPARRSVRQMEADGIVRRTLHPQVPLKVEYCLTKWGQALCPALDSLLKWAALHEKNG
jgi:hypothetical protein